MLRMQFIHSNTHSDIVHTLIHSDRHSVVAHTLIHNQVQKTATCCGFDGAQTASSHIVVASHKLGVAGCVTVAITRL